MNQDTEPANGEIILVNKPLFWSSFEAVNSFKRRVKPLKIGHAGTLDPMASGLLILCTGKKTKIIEQIQELPKIYTGTVKLGATTAGYDLESPEENIYTSEPITLEVLNDCIKNYVGEITQTPPLHSAIKIDGKRAYQYAKEDLAPVIKSKVVTVYEFEISNFNWPTFNFKIKCSKGTYIRSLANDVGQALQCGAYLTKLVRTQIGD
ncbi:MAG: tRNA pseudouridine(55) synthase TruB, partial [Bacteroidetes bacterium]|nr:tRNA pseudouridine(55) synthase TruB [Bacteroidota bacterium]